MYRFENDDEIFEFVNKMLKSEKQNISWVLDKEGIIKKEYLNYFEFLYQREFIFRSSLTGGYLINRKSLEYFIKHKGLTFEEVNILNTRKISIIALIISAALLIGTRAQILI